MSFYPSFIEGIRISFTNFLKNRQNAIFCYPPKNILKISSSPQLPTKCLNKKLIDRVDIAYRVAIRAAVFEDPRSSSRNSSTSITSAKTSRSKDLGPSGFEASTPKMHLFASLMKIFMMSGLRLILKISFIERIVSSQISASSM